MEAAERSIASSPSCATAILVCLALSIVYVASLYVWSEPHNREHPSTIKKRFFSIFIITFISPAPMYFVLNEEVFQKATIWEMLGLRWTGLIQAAVISLLLTMILFLGPLSLQGFNGLWRLYTAHVLAEKHTNSNFLEKCGDRSIVRGVDFQGLHVAVAFAMLHPDYSYIRVSLVFRGGSLSSRSGEGEDGNEHQARVVCILLPVYVYDLIWSVRSLSLCEDRTFCCTVCRACILQPHGIS